MPSKIGGRAGDRSGVTATVASVETATTIAIGGGEIQLDPECTLRVYPWQNLNHDLEETNQTLRNRREELLKENLAQRTDLQREWIALIEAMDNALKSKFETRSKSSSDIRRNEGEENREDAAGGAEAAAAAAVASILPPPLAVQHWLAFGSSSNAAGNPNYYEARAATEWLVNAVQHAHLSPTIKKAGRDLMACYNFTTNLGAFRCWDEILMPKLKAALVTLGEEAKDANAACNLAAVLTEEAILTIAPFHPDLIPKAASKKAPAGGSKEENNDGGEDEGGTSATPHPFTPPPRNAVRQDLLMPSLAAAVSADYARDWKQQPEHVYIHILLLLGTALDPLFGKALDDIVSDLEGVAVHTAPIKSFLRMLNKLRSKEDHQQVELRPRPAMNIDVVRRLAAAATGEDVLELARMVAARFGGLSHLKCLPELAATDPAAADARFHMLPVMLTVVFAPAGLTVGELLKDPAVCANWAALREVRPGLVVSTEQWQADHDAALAAFERCDPNEPVRMHCEVQVVTTATAAVRHKMHENYKVYRAENGQQLHADAAKLKPEDEDGTDLIDAADDGRIATVKRLLGIVVGEIGEDGAVGGGSVDVNRQNEGGATALCCAASRGHLPVVVVLLEHGNADPNQARTDIGATPLFMAAQNGHVEVVAKLLEHGATNPNQAETDNGATPLLAAAGCGHVEVVAKLLEHGATDPNQATTDTGGTPLLMAAQDGHVQVVAKLLEHGATDPNQAMFSGPFAGQGPVSVAAECGHCDIIAMLVSHGGFAGTALTSNGATDLWLACYGGHADVVRFLLGRPGVEIDRARSDARDAIIGPGDEPHPGTTPLEAAVLEGHDECAALIREAQQQQSVQEP